MMRRRWLFCFVLVGLLALLGGGRVTAGGWATVTLEALPTTVVAERPFTVQFTARQHGSHPIGGLSPVVTAVQMETGERIDAVVEESGEEGTYAATLTLPVSGEWRWSVQLFSAVYRMPPLNVVEAAPAAAPSAPAGVRLPLWAGMALLLGAAVLLLNWWRTGERAWLGGAAVALLLFSLVWLGERPLSLFAETATASEPAIAPEQMGEALFVAKGCIQCHQNGRVTTANNLVAVGPDLTNYVGNADFLSQWLANPTSIKPKTLMPNLELSEAEIDRLIVYLTTEAAAGK